MPPRPSRRFVPEFRADEVGPRLDIELPETTAGRKPGRTVIGQQRALDALRLGLGLRAPGYNIFVCGATGTGRTAAVRHALDTLQPTDTSAKDLGYVSNFKEPDRPILLEFERGSAEKFRDELTRRLDGLRDELVDIANATEEPRLDEERPPWLDRIAPKLDALGDKVEAAGFVFAPVRRGATIIPDLLYRTDEDEMSIDELRSAVKHNEIEDLDADDVEKIARNHEAFRDDVFDFLVTQRNARTEYHKAIDDEDRRAVQLAVDSAIHELKREAPGKAIAGWLDQVAETLVDNLDLFRKPAPAGPEEPPPEFDGPDMSAFDINVVLSHDDEACPVVVESHPTYVNLFGSQDRMSGPPGSYGNDFNRLRPGSFVRAQGGYLIVNVEELLRDPTVWDQLLRTLRTGKLVIQPPERSAPSGSATLTPDAIDVDVKVILVGPSDLYHYLLESDPRFETLFKVKAEFDTRIAIDDDSIGTYLDVIVGLIRDDDLLDVDRSGLKAILEESLRLTEYRDKLTTRFSLLADWLRESDHHARRLGATVVSAEHVDIAREQRRRRVRLIEDRYLERVIDGDVLIETEGMHVGQLNGLTIIDIGDHEFATAARVSCRTAAGRAGLVNIDREVELSGATHDKGMLILQGFLQGRYAQIHPLALSASLCFEQSYAYIDGDSASSTEIYALLSSLTQLPLRQDLAVTGAIDQFGSIQPVGGISAKIEGFFRLCAERGLTGTQGVLVPPQNRDNLLVDDEVVRAIEEGRFHIYPVATIDEGMELLTGVSAGVQEDLGRWTRDSVNDLVQRRLDDLFHLGNEEGS